MTSFSYNVLELIGVPFFFFSSIFFCLENLYEECLGLFEVFVSKTYEYIGIYVYCLSGVTVL